MRIAFDLRAEDWGTRCRIEKHTVDRGEERSQSTDHLDKVKFLKFSAKSSRIYSLLNVVRSFIVVYRQSR